MGRVLIIGGGFFGMYLADHIANEGHEVRIVEKEPDFMTRASYANQARVHNGYHYPRSILTALRSRISFPRFVNEFKDCIESDFEKYYLIGKPLGKVTAIQFKKFCERIGAVCDYSKGRVKLMTNPALIEECFSVVEYAFDAHKLRDLMLKRIDRKSISYSLNTSAEMVSQHGDGLLIELKNSKTDEYETIYADHVFNCTYSRINYIHNKSEIKIVPLKHEMTEMCLVKVPDELNSIGLTVMCGPFFSVMPFPSIGIHSFSHVRYTPHYEWSDSEDSYNDAHFVYDNADRYSAWHYMRKDAARYIPLLADCEYVKSIWEVKTVLPRSESDDSRPILFMPNYGMKGFHSIMGGKIDNVYDVIDSITSLNLIT
jgi:hypothetical protein